jgi:methyl-coenzyme M reductase beta subunit
VAKKLITRNIMAKFKDTIDLYDDEGKLLKSGVALDKISPLTNKGALKVIDLTKRTIAVNLAGIDNAIKTGQMGGKNNQILGRAVKVDCVKDCDALSAKIKSMVQVTDGDDTKITKVGGGKMLLVEVPSARLHAAATYDAASTAVAAATTYALIEQYKVGMFDGAYVKSAVWGSYPVTMDMAGGNIVSILSIPQNNEGLGYALRNIPANHAAMMTHRNAMQAAALSSTFEQAGEFEMGMAIGPFERAQLLLYAYQGLNANNIVYDLVKANGKTGTIGTVVQSLVERAIEDKVIKAGKKGKSGYIFYDTKDPMLWNAYAAAGTLAATMVNCGAGRFAQAVSATLLYFNDLLEHETGLPGCDYGRVMGVAVGFSFFSHSIYGGGGPGVFNGNHVVTRHAAGVGIPCIVAACALDAGTQMFGPEATSKIYQDTFGQLDEFKKPIQAVAKGI